MIACMIIGFAFGIGATFFFEYHWKPTMRVAGFPIPVAFFILEEDRWTDFVIPPLIAVTVIILNILLWITAFLALWKIATRPSKSP